MRLVMMATGPFAVPTFRSLLDGRHTVAALVTSPLRPPHGDAPSPGGPIREVARERGAPVFDPDDVNADSAREWIRNCQADLLVTCDYGQILSSATLAAARLGGVNLHASLLPKYRGAAPINWALYQGETETGATVIHMTPQIDAGPWIAQARTPIGPDETAPQLELRLAELGAKLVVETLDRLEAGTIPALPQDPALASKAPRLKKSDGALDWRRPADALRNQIRALEPWPKCYTYWRRAGGTPLRLIVAGLRPVDSPQPEAAPGAVLQADGDRLLVATGGNLAARLTAIQPAGKRQMNVEEFLRGYRVRVGDQLQDASS